MKKIFIFAFSICLIGILNPDSVFGAVKTGATCTRVGATSTVLDKKYTCIKSGKKLIWSKAISVKGAETSQVTIQAPATTRPDTSTAVSATDTKTAEQVFASFFERDLGVPAIWSDVQDWVLKIGLGARPYRYVQGAPAKDSLVTSISKPVSLDSNQCKIEDPAGRQWQMPSFINRFNSYRPTKSAVVQVIPLQFTDQLANSNPQIDYAKYIDFYKSFLINSSDVPISPEYRVPDHYFQVGFPMEKYSLSDGHVGGHLLLEDLSKSIAQSFNLSDVNQVLFLVPPMTPTNKAVQKMDFGNADDTAFRGKNLYLQGTPALGERFQNAWTADPWITIHELIGHQMDLDDTFGAGLGSHTQTMPSDLRDLGTGSWGNMAGVTGDFLIWQKWTVGWEYDSQIECLAPESKGTVLISPATTKSLNTKGVVIKLTGTRAIVIESQRSTGYNFKMPKATNGALVYIVEMKEVANGGGMPFGYGLYVQRPVNRPNVIWQNGMALGDATLKQGESIIVEGVKISVVEAGDFGDVVKIG